MKTLNLILVISFSLPIFSFAENIQASKVPKDVSALTTRIRECGHWAGEEPYDKARAAEIAAAIKKFRCVQLDQDEKAIRIKYKNSKEVLEAIDEAKKLPY